MYRQHSADDDDMGREKVIYSIRRRGIYILREEHAGERGGLVARTDAAQIRGNVALFQRDGTFEQRVSTARTRELKRQK